MGGIGIAGVEDKHSKWRRPRRHGGETRLSGKTVRTRLSQEIKHMEGGITAGDSGFTKEMGKSLLRYKKHRT